MNKYEQKNEQIRGLRNINYALQCERDRLENMLGATLIVTAATIGVCLSIIVIAILSKHIVFIFP